jgi:MAF protein
MQSSLDEISIPSYLFDFTSSLLKRTESSVHQFWFRLEITYVKIVSMLILASSSPRRQQLLTFLGVIFQVLSVEIDEHVRPGETPKEYVSRLALTKSQAINPPSAGRWVILAADTAVVDENQILGKPGDSLQAINMLRKLRARTHYVFTCLSVRDTMTEEVITDLSVTEVRMRSYHESEIRDYVASGDPLDKAGAYAIQNSDFNPVHEISGCYANVVGLPLCHLTELLKQMEIKYQEHTTHGCRTSHGYSCQLVEKIQEFSSP